MSIISIHVILIIKLTVLITIDCHSVRHQRIQSNDFTSGIPDYLTVRIPPKKQMRHQSLTEYKACHFRIRFIVEQKIKRMIHRLLFTTICRISVKL